jgi:hypothetical protein
MDIYMSLFNNRITKKALIGSLSFAQLGAAIGRQEESVYDANASAALLGNESHRLSEVDLASVTSSFSQVKTTLANCLGNESASANNLVTEAGARTAMIYANAEKLQTVIKSISSLGNESFSTTNGLRESRDYAVALAMVDADGRSASSLNRVFPVVDMNADYVTATLSLPRYEMVGNEYHTGTGAELTNWNRTHLVNAARVSGLLNGNQNRMYPAVVTGENQDLIIDNAKVPYGDVKTANGDTFKTGSLGNAASFNVMALCRAPGMPSTDSANYNDRIDAGGRIEAVYVNLADDVAHKVSVRHLSESIYGRNAQTSSRSTNSATIRGLVTRVGLTTATNAKLAALVTAGAKEMAIKIELNQSIDLHSGTMTQTYSTILVGLYANVGDTVNVIDNAAFDTAKAALNIAFLGSDLDLRWSSRTVRLTGLRVDTRSIDKTYTMTARRVISSDREVDTTNVDDVLSAMNMARRLSREDDGFTFLNDEITRLAALYGTSGLVKPDQEDTQYAGAYYLTQAWVKDAGAIKLKDLVKLESSSDTQADIGAAIVALLAEEFTAAVAVSGLESVASVYAPGSEITPVIAGPSNLLRYIMKTGEDRTFGSKGSIVSEEPIFAPVSLNTFDDTIIMVPQVTTSNSETTHAFSFGFTLECPPLVYDIPSERDGQSIRALRMTPFYEFVINMPIAYRVRITEVAEYLASLKTDTVVA